MPSKDDDLSKPSFRLAAPKSGKRRGFVPRGTSVLDVPEGGERRVPDTVLRRPPVGPDTITGYSPSMAQRHAESLAGALTPKIGGPRAQAISQSLLGGPESALPFGIGLQELVPFSPYVAEDAGQLIAQGVQEGSPLTTGLGVGLGVLQASPAIGPLARGARGVAQRAAAAADPEAIRRYVAATQGITGLPGTAVVKPKGLGGNWPMGDVERVTNPLKERVEGEIVTPEMAREHWDVASVDLSRKLALNQWIDQKLNRYIKNEMATPEDPVRRLAQQSRVTHLPSVSVAEGAPEMPLEHYHGWLRGPALSRLVEKRGREGFPIYGGDSSQYTGEIPSPERVLGANMGRGWENIADQAVNIEKAVDYQGIPANTEQLTKALDDYTAIRDDIANQFEAHVNSIPGLSEAEKASTIKGAGFGYMANMLGRHDEFKAAEQAVRKARIGFSNAERKLFAENPWIANVEPETRIYKLAEGQDSNRLGFNYIIDALRDDLAAGRISPEQLSKVTMEQAVRRTQEYNLEMAKKAADAAVKARVGLPVYKEYPEGYRWVELNRPGAFAFESDAMGHSVRGYEPPKGHPDWLPESGDQGTLGYGHGGWEAIKSGRARVYSLVDPQGKSNVTVEIRAKNNPTMTFSEARAKAAEEGVARNDDELTARANEIIESTMGPPKITQIKGSGKKDPQQRIRPEDAHLLPYIQDFVLGREWEDVADLENTGLKKYFKVFDRSEVAKLRRAGHKVPPYLSNSEAKRLQDELYKIETGKNPDTGEPLAAGGRVEAPEGAEDFIAQVRQRMQGQEQRMQAGGIVKKALGTLGAKNKPSTPIIDIPSPSPAANLPALVPTQTTSAFPLESIAQQPVTRRDVLKSAAGQAARAALPSLGGSSAAGNVVRAATTVSKTQPATPKKKSLNQALKDAKEFIDNDPSVQPLWDAYKAAKDEEMALKKEIWAEMKKIDPGAFHIDWKRLPESLSQQDRDAWWKVRRSLGVPGVGETIEEISEFLKWPEVYATSKKEQMRLIKETLADVEKIRAHVNAAPDPEMAEIISKVKSLEEASPEPEIDDLYDGLVKIGDEYYGAKQADALLAPKIKEAIDFLSTDPRFTGPNFDVYTEYGIHPRFDLEWLKNPTDEASGNIYPRMLELLDYVDKAKGGKGMAGGGIVKKALGTLSKEADTLKPTFKMPGADMPLAKIPESAPKVTEKTVEIKPGGAKAQKVTQSVIETPLSRRQVIKTAGSQVAQKVIPRISTDIPQLTPEEMFGGVADMPGLYAAMLPLVRRVAPHELDSMAKRLGFSLEDIIEHSAEDILPRGELVNEGVTRFMELFPETSSKVLKKAGGGIIKKGAKALTKEEPVDLSRRSLFKLPEKSNVPAVAPPPTPTGSFAAFEKAANAPLSRRDVLKSAAGQAARAVLPGEIGSLAAAPIKGGLESLATTAAKQATTEALKEAALPPSSLPALVVKYLSESNPGFAKRNYKNIDMGEAIDRAVKESGKDEIDAEMSASRISDFLINDRENIAETVMDMAPYFVRPSDVAKIALGYDPESMPRALDLKQMLREIKKASPTVYEDLMKNIRKYAKYQNRMAHDEFAMPKKQSKEIEKKFLSGKMTYDELNDIFGDLY